MGASLIGSRYTLHLARRGLAEGRQAPDYRSLYPADTELEAPSDDLVGYVHSYEVGSTADGPGLRFVVILTGCVLRCQYCHNPDAWHKHNGNPVTVSRTMKVLGKYAVALKDAGGGVTLSGGEPVLQRGFLMSLVGRCRELGLHTCLDTSGRLGARLTDDDLAAIDLNLLDLKAGDASSHERITGAPFAPTLDYARRLAALRRPMWIRYVLVPGLTDGHDHVERVADVCAGLAGVERVQVLRFHQLGREKWSTLGLDYPLRDVEPPDAALTERVRSQFRRRGLAVS